MYAAVVDGCPICPRCDIGDGVDAKESVIATLFRNDFLHRHGSLVDAKDFTLGPSRRIQDMDIELMMLLGMVN